jgi:hypothetical protein
VPAFAPPLDPGASAAAIRSRLDALRVADRRVVAVLADSTSPFSSAEYDADVRADRVTVQWLAADTTVRVEADVPWRELGLRLRVFRFTTGRWASAAPGR